MTDIEKAELFNLLFSNAYTHENLVVGATTVYKIYNNYICELRVTPVFKKNYLNSNLLAMMAFLL